MNNIFKSAAVLLLGIGTAFGSYAKDLGPKVSKSTQERIIITTDLEVDDMNGLILSLMYADQYDLAGIIWTSGMYHFQGDGGVHTLAEITPGYKCNAQHCEHTVANAGELRSYRPVDPTWLDRIIDCYESDYRFLSQNNPNYPTPEYIRSITKVGNIEFEGDYRFETEGSKFIEQCIMDDDMRPLVIQHWGGINTTVRALYSIYEKYHGTADWEKVLAKVQAKVRIGGSGEDNCRKDSGIDEMFPGLLPGGYGLGTYFSYGTFFASSDSPMRSVDWLQPYMHKDWIMKAYKTGHGKLMEQIWLIGEGRAIFGEPWIYNYGLNTQMDWGKSAQLGWGPENLSTFPVANYEPYSWAFCQFGVAQFVNIGLRDDVDNSPDKNYYTKVMWEELAARSDWAIEGPDRCNHAPVVTPGETDLTCKAGKSVILSAEVSDPDDDNIDIRWTIPVYASTYKEGKAEGLAPDSTSGSTAVFTVPKDAKVGDKFVVTLEAKDSGVERPMTRYAQYVITVSKR